MCPYCNRPLMEIDHYGEMLVGCIECNRWGHPGDEKSSWSCWKAISRRCERANGNDASARLGACVVFNLSIAVGHSQNSVGALSRHCKGEFNEMDAFRFGL